jgi:hypothetical protein
MVNLLAAIILINMRKEAQGEERGRGDVRQVRAESGNTVVGIDFDLNNTRKGDRKQSFSAFLVRKAVQNLVGGDREELWFESCVKPSFHLQQHGPRVHGRSTRCRSSW